MKQRSRSQGNHPHIVVSTKELHDPSTIAEWFESKKSCKSYIVAIEYGTGGHAHLECFSSWDKEVRQDKIKEQVLKMYGIEDYHGKLNTKVTFNHIDPDPMYGYGYALKENPKDYYTNCTAEYLEASKQYYQDHCEAVGLAKQEARKEYNKVQVNQVVDDYIDWLHERGVYELLDKYAYNGCTNVNNHKDLFNLFYAKYPKRISYTEFSKIRIESIQEYVNMELLRKRGISS